MPGAQDGDAAAAADGQQERSNDSTVLCRKLGNTGAPTYLETILTNDGERFVVVERVPRGAMSDDEAAESVREARIAATLEHPNVVRTRAVTVRSHEITVTSDYLAAERLSELWFPATGPAAALPIEIALRILVDAATGLGALHKLRSKSPERQKYVHGEVTAENVLVGVDGVSAILRAARVRLPHAPPATLVATLAPEVVAGQAIDHRADVYAIGALLWQALYGRPFTANDAVAVLRDGDTADPFSRNAPQWARPLGGVVARALDPAPDKRFPTASSMVTELRKIAGPKLASIEQVARFVEAAAGEKIAARLTHVQASAVMRKATSIPPPRPARETPARLPSSSQAVSGQAALLDHTFESPAPSAEDARTPAGNERLPPSAAPGSEAPRAIVDSPAEEPRFIDDAAAVNASSRAHAVPANAAPVVRQASEPLRNAEVAPALFAAQRSVSPLAQRGVRLGVAAIASVALVTGAFALRAIRNRHAIETPGAARPELAITAPPPSALPPPVAASALPLVDPAPSLAEPSTTARKVNAVPAAPAPPTMKPPAPKTSLPRKAPPSKTRRK